MTTRFTFAKRREENNQFETADIYMYSNALTITEILGDFQDFLRGCGYVFEGNIVIEDDTTD